MVRICVVEDDPILMEFILFNLVKEGYSTLKYTHGDHVMANIQATLEAQLLRRHANAISVEPSLLYKSNGLR